MSQSTYDPLNNGADPNESLKAQAPSPAAADAQPIATERPEVALAGAFTGGLLLALLLRRIGSR